MIRALCLAFIGLLSSLALAASATAYSWPFKPFNRQHPIRGFFGDPRTVYEDGILSGAFDGPGFFSFHQGVDISAPDGTPIYASENGTAHYLGAATLNIVTDHDVVFQYFHIVTVVGEGQQVIARKTILGYVQPPYGHVHITEIDGTKVVNPLQPGHLAPYKDFTKPVIRNIVIRDQTGEVQTPLGMCGRIELDVDAYDTPPVAVPGKFQGLPVAPSLVQWTVTNLHGAAVVPWRTAADFRATLPSNAHFWDTYAKGDYQNAPRFGKRAVHLDGRPLPVQLARSYDTTALANGVYVLTVLVGDGHGHKASTGALLGAQRAKRGIWPAAPLRRLSRHRTRRPPPAALAVAGLLQPSLRPYAAGRCPSAARRATRTRASRRTGCPPPSGATRRRSPGRRCTPRGRDARRGTCRAGASGTTTRSAR